MKQRSPWDFNLGLSDRGEWRNKKPVGPQVPQDND